MDLATRKSKSRKITERQYPKERSSQLTEAALEVAFNTWLVHIAASLDLAAYTLRLTGWEKQSGRHALRECVRPGRSSQWSPADLIGKKSNQSQVVH